MTLKRSVFPDADSAGWVGLFLSYIWEEEAPNYGGGFWWWEESSFALFVSSAGTGREGHSGPP